MNREYAEKVEVLLRLLPIVMEEKVFAVHGGSAINLFVRNLPRYSVDIDLTYIPLEGREESLEHINAHLMSIAGGASAFRLRAQVRQPGLPGHRCQDCGWQQGLRRRQGQVFRIYFYERGGARNFVLTLGMNDVNKAKRLN